MKPALLVRLFAALCLVSCIVTAAPVAGCGATPAQVESVTATVFTAENVVCMVTGLITNAFTLAQSPEAVARMATDIEEVCQIAPALTADVEKFVDVFVAVPPVDAGSAVSAKYAAVWAAHREHD